MRGWCLIPSHLSCVYPSTPQDSVIVVESFKSGFEPPVDFPFEDFSQNLSRTGSDGTISNTPKGDRDRDRDGAPGPRSDPKHAMSRTKNKLWLFGKKPKVQGARDACCSFKVIHPLLHYHVRGSLLNMRCEKFIKSLTSPRTCKTCSRPGFIYKTSQTHHYEKAIGSKLVTATPFYRHVLFPSLFYALMLRYTIVLSSFQVINVSS